MNRLGGRGECRQVTGRRVERFVNENSMLKNVDKNSKVKNIKN